MSKSNSAVLDLNLNPLFDLEHQLLIADILKKTCHRVCLQCVNNFCSVS